MLTAYLSCLVPTKLMLLRANLLAVTGMFSKGFLGVATWEVEMFRSISESAYDMWEVGGLDRPTSAPTPTTGTGKHGAGKAKGKEGAASAAGGDVSGGFRVSG